MVKPKIIIKRILNGEIVEMVIKKIVKKLGRSGYVSVPKELIGKYVEIKYVKDNK